MILEFLDVFSEKTGKAKGVVHSVRMLDGCVIWDHWQSLPYHLWRAVKQEITQMLKLDIIEESQSPWRSPLVIVPKPDGTIRVCVDFRKVNEVAVFDAFPMTQVEEMIEKISQAKYSSTLDLTRGYWQIPMDTVDKEKTAFEMP